MKPKYLKYIVFLLPLLLTSCISQGTSGGGGIDKIFSNKIIIWLIVIAAIYIAFKGGFGGKKE